MIRNGYPSFVQYTTFIIPELEAFTGDSDGWIPTYVDLSAYQNESVYLRFNFATSDGGVPAGGGFWFIDDVELLDLFSYNGEACARSAEGDEACTTIGQGGIIVESQLSTSTDQVEGDDEKWEGCEKGRGEIMNVKYRFFDYCTCCSFNEDYFLIINYLIH